MQALLIQERTLTELDHAQSAQLIRPDSCGTVAPPTLLERMRRNGQALRRRLNRLLRQVRDRGSDGNSFGTYSDDELRGLLDRLRRSELDQRGRLAVRIEALGGVEASISDPLYQRHYFAVESFETQRAEVESEFLRRADPGSIDTL